MSCSKKHQLPRVLYTGKLWLCSDMIEKLRTVPLKLSTNKQVSRLMGKPTICISENKDADQLRGNREADQRLCFRYSDSTIPLLLKSEISSFWLFSALVQAGLCRTCSETTLLVFPRGGSSNALSDTHVQVKLRRACYELMGVISGCLSSKLP